MNVNDLKSPAKKVESALLTRKSKNLNNNEKLTQPLSSKPSKKFKESQKKLEKKNEEIENALKSLVTVKREALIQRNQIRQQFNKLEAKFSDQIKKTITLKTKVPEIAHNFTKKLINFQETLNFKDYFFLEPVTKNKIFRKDYQLFEETLKAENNKKLAIVNRKFRKILTKIGKKELNNGFKQVLLAEQNICKIQKEGSSKSVEISANFFFEEAKSEKNNGKIEVKKRSASFSHTNYALKSLKTFSSTQSLFSKSVSRESLKENDRKKIAGNKSKLLEIPFAIDFNCKENTRNEDEVFFINNKLLNNILLKKIDQRKFN